MNSTLTYALLIVLLASLTTVLLRAFPFISPAAIAMLCVYCFCSHWQSRGVPAGGAEFVAGTVVVALQLWKRNPLLSILAGTVIYMILVQQL